MHEHIKNPPIVKEPEGKIVRGNSDIPGFSQQQQLHRIGRTDAYKVRFIVFFFAKVDECSSPTNGYAGTTHAGGARGRHVFHPFQRTRPMHAAIARIKSQAYTRRNPTKEGPGADGGGRHRGHGPPRIPPLGESAGQRQYGESMTTAAST